MIQEPDSPVLVVGLPRSGTTLMRMMLSSHPRLAIAPETNFLNSWMRVYGHLDPARPRDFELFWKALTESPLLPSFGLEADAVRARIPAGCAGGFRDLFTAICRAYAARTGKPRWGEKTPRHAEHLDTLRAWFPDARIIFMQRDPRAVVSSILAKNWARSSRFCHVHARRWRHTMADAHRRAARDDLLLVSYEKLVRQGEFTLREICAWIGEDYHPDMLTRSQAHLYRLYPDDADSLAQQPVLKPLNPASLDKWRDRLSPAQIAIIEHEAGPVLETLGYEPTGIRAATWQAVYGIQRALRPAEAVVRLPWGKIFGGAGVSLVRRWLP